MKKRGDSMKHFIIVKWKEPQEMKSHTEEIRSLFEKTLDIDGINAVDVYDSCSDRSNRHDLMIEIDMDAEALPAYDKSEPHHEWKASYGDFIAHKTIFDHE